MKMWQGFATGFAIMILGAWAPVIEDANASDDGLMSDGEYSYLLAGEPIAIAYSGFREGQHPDRGNGAVNPSKAEILEDLQILVAHDLRLIRLYDTGDNARTTLELIREHELPIKVLQGIWLNAEISNHEGCPWLDEPIPEEELAANVLVNQGEIQRGIDLARQFP